MRNTVTSHFNDFLARTCPMTSCIYYNAIPCIIPCSPCVPCAPSPSPVPIVTSRFNDRTCPSSYLHRCATPMTSCIYYEVIFVHPAPLAPIVTSLVSILWSPDGGILLLTQILSPFLTWLVKVFLSKGFAQNLKVCLCIKL